MGKGVVSPEVILLWELQPSIQCIHTLHTLGEAILLQSIHQPLAIRI